MESIYSKEWHEKNDDRKDFTYTPKVKNLMDAMCWRDKTPEDRELGIKILDNYIHEE